MRLRHLLLPLLVVACGSADTGDDAEGGDDAITSNDAQIVDFTFDGEVIAAKETDTRKAIIDQLFYTVGILTTNFNANGQVGRVTLSNVQPSVNGATQTIKYHAVTPVAWPKGQKVPKTQAMTLPHDATKLDAFNAKYDGKCGKNEYGQDTFWHDWNPLADGCTPDAADVFKSTAKVTKDKTVTTGKYPEYDLVWADNAFNVVALFGESDGGAQGDAGVAEYESFLEQAKAAVPNAQTKENAKTASVLRDVTISGDSVTITALLIDTLYTAGPDFDTRYDPLSEKADMVIYNGHSELSKNTNALARKGKVDAKQYQIFFFDSCDTYAYLDTSLTDRRKQVNPDDPKGTKYLDVATNVLPSYFSNYANSSMTLVKALIAKSTPKTYNEILSELPSDQVVVVSGEEDNAFQP
jgi:hypothetical protein